MPAPQAPVITGIFPASGTTAGGTTVRISGSGFTGVERVDFGTARATHVHADPAGNSITVTTPAGTGTVVVTVVTVAGKSAPGGHDRFTYLSPAALSRLPAGTPSTTRPGD